MTLDAKAGRALEPLGDARIEGAGDRDETAALAAQQMIVVGPRQLVAKRASPGVRQAHEQPPFHQPADGAKDGRRVAVDALLLELPTHFAKGPGVRSPFALHRGEKGRCDQGGAGHARSVADPNVLCNSIALFVGLRGRPIRRGASRDERKGDGHLEPSARGVAQRQVPAVLGEDAAGDAETHSETASRPAA